MRTDLTLITATLGFVCCVTPAFAAVSFDTVDDIDQAINYVESMNILSPMSDGLFHGELPLQRIDLLTGIVRTMYPADVTPACFDEISSSVPSKFTYLFRDIPRSSVKAQEVCVGILAGLVSGTPDGSFNPFGGTNLVDAAKIISKSYGIAPLPSLRIQSGVAWHEPYWFALAKRNAIPQSIKDRNANITRGEFASIMYTLKNVKPDYGFGSHSKYSVKETTPADAVLSTVRAAMAGSNQAVGSVPLHITEQTIEMRSRIEGRKADRFAKWQALSVS